MSILRTSALLLFFPLVAMSQSNPRTIKPSNKIHFDDQFPGADACIQIQNAIAALPLNGRGGDRCAEGLLGFSEMFRKSDLPTS